MTGEAALAAAEDFLVNGVGDLLMVEGPRLTEQGRPRWELVVTLGNVVRGDPGPVGSIAVDAETGEILFSERDRARILRDAVRLSGSVWS